MPESKPVGSVRERLLQSARELFYREGVHSVGIDRVLSHAGVAKASLYGTFGSKDELVRAYLDERSSWLQARIQKRLSEHTDARARILAVFDEFSDRTAAGAYYGCPFIRACAEAPLAVDPAHDAAASHRRWQRELFQRLAEEAGIRDAEGIGQQLALIYDGATVAVSMEQDPSAARAARAIVERLLSGESKATAPKKARASTASSARKKS
ncbi:MAG TPA: TetR/AcrR family transcriptional regulator [Polyangiaceae bacterium]|nr:TetR/AcrR family transcriptional regulator [Polyangiaceae bacterium]